MRLKRFFVLCFVFRFLFILTIFNRKQMKQRKKIRKKKRAGKLFSLLKEFIKAGWMVSLLFFLNQFSFSNLKKKKIEYLSREQTANDCYQRGKVFIDASSLPHPLLPKYLGSFLYSSPSLGRGEKKREKREGGSGAEMGGSMTGEELVSSCAVRGYKYTSSGERRE